MSEITRKESIRRLERLLKCGDGTYEFKVEINTDDQKAVQFAIDSLETDEAYQLEYERTTQDIPVKLHITDVKEHKSSFSDLDEQPEICEDAEYKEPTTENETLVSLGAYKQVAWERDVAIEQLHELGYEFGQKIEPTTKNDLAVDCISRKDTIEYLKQVTVTDGITFETGFKQILLDIENMPSVLPKAKWIPVTEKLPHDRDWYLGIFKEPDTGWINPLPYICDYVGRETKATTKEYWILRGFTDIDEPCDYYLNLECVAWMPLPEPYELQESEDNNAEVNK